MLFEALTTRKTVTVGEKLIVPYKLAEVRKKYIFILSFKSINLIDVTRMKSFWIMLDKRLLKISQAEQFFELGGDFFCLCMTKFIRGIMTYI